MAPRFCFWAPYPNRHLEPFLDEAQRVGALVRTVYEAEHQARWQLGTSPARREGQIILPQWNRQVAVSQIVRSTRADFHLMFSFSGCSRDAAWACALHRAPHFLLVESLRPRSPLHPARIARSLLYPEILRASRGVFAMGPKAARECAAFGVPRANIYPAAYAGPVAVSPYRSRQERRLLYCGRLLELKGLDVLADALVELWRRGRPVALEVAGDGPARAWLDRLRSVGIGVTAHGAVPSSRIPEIMARVAALVLPTRWKEGWGYVVNEAIAAGIPAVVSDVVTAREALVPGASGVVFRSGDAAALARAIEDVLALHQRPAEVERALGSAVEGLAPEPFVRYLLEAVAANLSDTSQAPVPPWHASAETLGGNPETRWWRDFKARSAAESRIGRKDATGVPV